MLRPLVVLALAFTAGNILAQDLRNIEPEPVPPVAPPAPQAEPPGKATGGPALTILDELKGLVLISHPGQVTERPSLDADGIDSRRVPMIDQASIRQKLTRYIGNPLSQLDLQQLLAEINAFYAREDLPFVSATAPEQDITRGVLRILVVEAKLGEVTVEGNRWFSEEQYLEAFGLERGDALQHSTINAGLDWIARNPFRAATIVAEPGEQFGETDFRLQVNERRPLRVYASASNTGTDNTDKERLAFGANWGNAFGLGHQLNTQVTASPDFHKSVGVSASYVAPLVRRHLLTVSAAYSRINADVPDQFDSTGSSWQLLLGYEVPLQPMRTKFGGYTHALRTGAEFKRSDNNLEFGGLPVTNNVTDIVQAVIGYSFGLEDPLGYTSVSTQVTYAPGNITHRNDDAYFNDSRRFAEAEYTFGRIELYRQTRLPAAFSWNLMVAGQVADGNLLGSEQLGLSGAHGVRGYDSNAAYSDQGVLVRNELLTPAWRSGKNALQPFAFYDYGTGTSEYLLAGEDDRTTVSSLGLGARYNWSNAISLRFEYGWQQDAAPYTNYREQQGHFSLTVNY